VTKGTVSSHSILQNMQSYCQLDHHHSAGTLARVIQKKLTSSHTASRVSLKTSLIPLGNTGQMTLATEPVEHDQP